MWVKLCGQCTHLKTRAQKQSKMKWVNISRKSKIMPIRWVGHGIKKNDIKCMTGMCAHEFQWGVHPKSKHSRTKLALLGRLSQVTDSHNAGRLCEAEVHDMCLKLCMAYKVTPPPPMFASTNLQLRSVSSTKERAYWRRKITTNVKQTGTTCALVVCVYSYRYEYEHSRNNDGAQQKTRLRNREDIQRNIFMKQ